MGHFKNQQQLDVKTRKKNIDVSKTSKTDRGNKVLKQITQV
jgi:hypothetical protein